MKKRVAALFLAVLMTFCLLPSAAFAADRYYISASIYPENTGRVEGIENDGYDFFAYADPVEYPKATLTAVPADGYEFAGWYGMKYTPENPEDPEENRVYRLEVDEENFLSADLEYSAVLTDLATAADDSVIDESVVAKTLYIRAVFEPKPAPEPEPEPEPVYAAVIGAPQGVGGLVYNGSAQTLVTDGLAENGQMVYSLDGFSWSAELPSATDAGDYTVYYKAAGFDGYEDSDVASVTVGIAKANPEYTVPSGLTAVEEQTLAEVALPEGFTWQDSGILVGSPGDNSFPADFTPSDTANYNTVNDISVIVTVTRKEPSEPASVVTAPGALSLVYSGSAQKLVSAGVAENGSMYYSPDDYTWSGEIPSGTAAGEYTVLYKALGNEGYLDSDIGSVNVSIAKATPAYTVPTGLTAVEGNTLANVPLPQGFAWQDSESTSVGSKGNNRFRVSYTPADTNNYNVVSDIEVSVAVSAKAPDPAATVRTAPQAVANLVYSGKAQKLLTAGQAENGVMNYSLDGYAWSADIPTGYNAGNYSVYYKAKANPGYTDSAPLSVNVNIAKANPKYSAPTGLTAVEGNLLSDLKLPSGFSWQDSENTSVGSKGKHNFYVRYTPSDANNYNTVENISVTITVSEKTPATPASVKMAPAAVSGLVYNGKAQKLSSTGQAENGVMNYSLDGKSWSADVPSGTNAGSYTVYYKAKGSDGHSDSATGSIKVSIAKANPSYSVPSGLTAYEGQTLSSVKLPSGFAWQDSVKTSVGSRGSRTFYVSYTPSDANNYKKVENISVRVAVSAAPAPTYAPAVTASVKTYPAAIRNLVYTGRAQPLVTPGKAENGSMRYSLNGTTWFADIPTGTDAGSYTVYYKAAGYNSSYDSKTFAVTVNINKANPSYSVPAGITAVEGQTLSGVRLPSGFAWQQAGTTSVGTVGTRSFTAYYTPSDTKNYNVISNIPVSVTVSADRTAADRAAATAASAKIGAIGEVKFNDDSRAKIDTAKSTYAALTDAQKALVSDADKKLLSDAEMKYAALKAQAEAGSAVTYQVLESVTLNWTKGSGQNQVFKGSGELKDFVGIRIDGKTVDSRYYILRSGSTVIEVSSEYMEQLTTGKHSVELLWKDGSAVSSFTVSDASAAKPEPARTGDDSGSFLWLSLLAGSACTLLALAAYGKKRKLL